MSRRSAWRSVSLSLVSAVLALACAETPRTDPAPAPSGAVLAPEAGRLAQDVRWLADDARDGRRAGTGGEEQAAHWLAQRLDALGLEPAGTDGFLGFGPARARRRQSTIGCAPATGASSARSRSCALFCSAERVRRAARVAGYGSRRRPGRTITRVELNGRSC
jgi:hypothetical protein